MPLSWPWRLFALALFMVVMAIISKVGWALISNGYYWPVFLFLGLGFVYAAWVDYRNGLPVTRPMELWREHWRR